MTKRPLLLATAMAALLLVLPGCSLLGLAVGSQIPHFDPIEHATRGDALRVYTRDGDMVRGAAVVVEKDSLTILDDDSHEHVLSSKRVARMYRRHGSEWVSTFAIGAITDGLAITSIIIAAALGAFSH